MDTYPGGFQTFFSLFFPYLGTRRSTVRLEYSYEAIVGNAAGCPADLSRHNLIVTRKLHHDSKAMLTAFINRAPSSTGL